MENDFLLYNILIADELGSGMRNTYKYTKLYSGGTPEFIEGDIFRTIIPLNEISVGVVGPKVNTIQDTIQETIQDTIQDGTVDRLLEFCTTEKNRKEMQLFLGISNRSYFNEKYLKPLLKAGKLKMTIPDKPTSRYQKYIKS